MKVKYFSLFLTCGVWLFVADVCTVIEATVDSFKFLTFFYDLTVYLLENRKIFLFFTKKNFPTCSSRMRDPVNIKKYFQQKQNLSMFKPFSHEVHPPIKAIRKFRDTCSSVKEEFFRAHALTLECIKLTLYVGKKL